MLCKTFSKIVLRYLPIFSAILSFSVIFYANCVAAENSDTLVNNNPEILQSTSVWNNSANYAQLAPSVHDNGPILTYSNVGALNNVIGYNHGGSQGQQGFYNDNANQYYSNPIGDQDVLEVAASTMHNANQTIAVRQDTDWFDFNSGHAGGGGAIGGGGAVGGGGGAVGGGGTNDKHGTHGEISFEGNAAKVTLILVALLYLILGAIFKTSHLDNSLSLCHLSPHDEHLPVFHVNADNPNKHYFEFAPHGKGFGSMQNDMYGMFTSYGRNSGKSDEDNSMEMSDLSDLPSMCSKNEFFWAMNPQHMHAVDMVQNVFMDQPGPDQVMHVAKGLQHSKNMNPKVWYTAMMKAAYERSDMGGMNLPGPLDAMPDTFIPGDSLRNTMARLSRSGKRRSSHKKGNKCIRVDGSVGKDNGYENSLWYFREDLMVNSHHWYWHLAYPLMSKLPRDRRGELFYFSHKSMTTRYNIERLANGFEFAKPLDLFPGAPIPEGYSAHLMDHNAGLTWTDRPPYTLMSDISHLQDPNTRTQRQFRLVDWLGRGDRVLHSIHTGSFLMPHGNLWIPKYDGIDVLGNVLEANALSINPQFYGVDGYHNEGHLVLGLAVDPAFHHRLPPGPMGDPATAMRDPIFYRWHTNTNNMFEKYKSTLKPYHSHIGHFPLLWKGVAVKDVSIVSHNGKKNKLKTFWGKREFDLSLGLAFNRTADDDDDDEHLKVCATHLDHEEFKYEIVVDQAHCASSHSHLSTVRIFLAPRFDLHGHRFTISQQRQLFVHLDMFTVELKPGRNVITRHSIDSSLTIPWTQTLSQLQAKNSQGRPNCGCGWPHHLLLPKGTPDGMLFDIFVMVTNGDQDIVVDHQANQFGGGGGQCDSPFIFCGIQNRKFPDARPMGYPFDREIHGGSIWSKILSLFGHHAHHPLFLEDFMHGVSNMGATQVVIKHIGGKD